MERVGLRTCCSAFKLSLNHPSADRFTYSKYEHKQKRSFESLKVVEVMLASILSVLLHMNTLKSPLLLSRSRLAVIYTNDRSCNCSFNRHKIVFNGTIAIFSLFESFC